MFLQGIKLEEQKPGPQKNKVGWAGDRHRRGSENQVITEIRRDQGKQRKL